MSTAYTSPFPRQSHVSFSSLRSLQRNKHYIKRANEQTRTNKISIGSCEMKRVCPMTKSTRQQPLVNHAITRPVIDMVMAQQPLQLRSQFDFVRSFLWQMDVPCTTCSANYQYILSVHYSLSIHNFAVTACTVVQAVVIANSQSNGNGKISTPVAPKLLS